MNRRQVIALLALFAAAAPSVSYSEPYPARPVKIIVPFPAGGTMDLVVRTVANDLAKALRQPVIVENKPGGGTVIGVDAVAKSPPDGQTLIAIGNSFTVNHTLIASLPYDSLKDLRPVILLTRTPVVLVGHPSLEARTLPQLIALAKADPNKLTYASVGNGSIQHLAGETLKTMAGVEITHVPYKGQAPALSDLLGGQIGLMFGNLPEILPYVRASKLRAYGVTTLTRTPLAEDIPTIAEQGFPGFETFAWFGLLAPAGVPDAVVARLNREIREILSAPETRQSLLARGIEPIPNSPAEFDSFLRSEITKYAQVIRQAHIKVD